MSEKKRRYLANGPRSHLHRGDEKERRHFVRAWKEGRHEVVVQVWLDKEEPIGEPDGDWAMPALLGLIVCIDQAITQTEPRK